MLLLEAFRGYARIYQWTELKAILQLDESVLAEILRVWGPGNGRATRGSTRAEKFTVRV